MDLLERRVTSVLIRDASSVQPTFTVHDIRRYARLALQDGSGQRRLAFDGLRGVAVALVVAFHHGYSWAKGGFVGVSVFFTLSGWLITNQVVRSRTPPALGVFLGRRVRRLFPAAIVTIAFTLTLVRMRILDGSESANDAIASVLSVSNWRFANGGKSYAALFSSPSPFQQFWSLSVEEQFYLGFGLSVAVVARRGRAALNRMLRLALPASAAVFAIAPLAHHLAGSATYYWTHVRMAEVGVGVGLATVSARRMRTRARTRSAAEWLCGASLVMIGAASVFARVDSLWLHVWLPAVAIGTGILIDAIDLGDAVAINRALTNRLLVHLGTRSYAIYLVHWPVFLGLTRSRLHASGNVLFLVRVAFVLLLAEGLHRLVEEPVRRGRVLANAARARTAAAAAITIVVAGAVAAPASGSYNLKAELDRAKAELPFSADAAAAASTDATDTTPTVETEPVSDSVEAPAVPDPRVAPAPIRIATFGDSTMLRTAWGLQVWGRSAGVLDIVGGVSELGCGIARDGERRHNGKVEVLNQACVAWADGWPASIANREVSVAVVQAGPWDVLDRRLPGSQRWLSPGDPVFDSYLADEIGAAMDVLLSAAPRLVWLTSPTLYFDLNSASGNPLPESDPKRVMIFNGLVRAQAGTRPGVAIVELGDYIDGLDRRGSVADLRPDGVHFSDRSAPAVAAWLGPEIMHAVHVG
jgi:peptidoglycan/LPS O-acetylase OafA/YrhL